ncbi:MAG: hypothetical protein D6814_18165, partial [Calditrichaeota bacterium]
MKALNIFKKDPLAKIAIKYKLPLGFITLNLIIFAIGGYFMINSVYAPLNNEIMARLKSESLAQASIFDKKLETLARRAEDFSSDGFIRTQTAILASRPENRGDPGVVEARKRLQAHLQLNKLPLEKDFYDLQIYSLNHKKLVGLQENSLYASQIFNPVPAGTNAPSQYFSPIAVLNVGTQAPMSAVVTPLWDIYKKQKIGYLVCVIHLGRVIREVASTYQDVIARTKMEKYLTLIDQNGAGLEVPWQFLKP